MYTSFYGLNEKPFSLTPDPKFLFLSRNCQDAFNNLMYGIREREGFMLLTGEVGTGKTMVLRTLVGRLGQDISSALVLNPMLEEIELLKLILEDFGIENIHGTKKELIDRLNEFLLAEARQNRRAVLIIDESQDLSDQVLEQIRLLSNLETEKSKLLQIILAAQLELQHRLESSFLRQLNQRISIRYQLHPLNKADTGRYIQHRLSIAGSDGNITFSSRAVQEIFGYSQGIPRLINLICDRVLLAGYTEQTKHLKKNLIKKAVKSVKNEEMVPSPRLSLIDWVLGGLVVTLSCIFLLSRHHEISGYLAKSRLMANMSMAYHAFFDDRPLPRYAVYLHEDIYPSFSEVKEGVGTNGLYSIHIASSKDKESALRELDRLKKFGHEVFLTPVDIPGKGIWYRMMLGRFKTKAAAMAVAENLRNSNEFGFTRVLPISLSHSER